MEENKYVMFLDQTGRTIFAEKADEQQSGELAVTNPVMINVQQQQQGQMAVQLFPLFFGEFVEPDADGNRDVTFVYKNDQITMSKGFDIDARIGEQYQRIVRPKLVENVPAQGDDKVINLFEE
jgi:hypothetical protein